MRQAQTLTDAQLRRVLHYCRSRRHPLRDETIILTSFYAGLRAIEIAALKYADVYDEQGSVRDQFTLRATQSKGGRTRTVYIGSKLKRALKEYQASIVRHRENMPLFPSQKGGHFSANTMCQLFLDIYKAMWSERCLKSLRAAHLHHQACQQRSWS